MAIFEIDGVKVEETDLTNTLFSEDKTKEELYVYTLRHLAYANSQRRDQITQLRNLSSFFFLTDEMIRTNPSYNYGCVLFDITQFKAVNEFCGRQAGDQLLMYIADALINLEKSRPFTIACHIRADVFCFSTAFHNEDELADVVKHLLNVIHNSPLPYHVHPSFGICAVKEYMPEASIMKDRATMALSKIKGKFYADYLFYDESMKTKIMHDREIENDILGAIKNNEIVPFIQPKVNMETNEIIGGEALVRWISKDKGIIPPGSFIPLFEENGFIVTLDKLIWESIFKLQRKRIDERKKVVPISVNLSRIHIYDDSLVNTLTSLSKEYNVDPSLILIELTESAMVENTEDIYDKMRVLQSHGFKISMDDFGTGYSSLFMLKKQPVDEVKMDRAFVLDLDKPESIIILQNTAKMLIALGKKIIVEGIETEKEKNVLLENGLINGQGYYFYKPMPVSDFEELLDK